MNLLFEEETKKERRRQVIKEILWFIVMAVLVIILAWLIVHFALKRVSMIGSSMETTLYNGQDTVVNRSSYLILKPKRGSVIAFYPEANDDEDATVQKDSTIQIRRIVGLPGERVQIRDGKLYINDEELSEKYDFGEITSPGQANQEILLDEDEYFVLSDKRSDIDDSRSSSFTKVTRKNIIGKVLFSMNPFAMISGPQGTSEQETQEGNESETNSESD